MAKRWFIIKGDKPTGPYTAAEIRQLLRDGAVDPFDFVAADGSPVQQELVEVDEIFANENVGYAEKERAVSGGYVPPIAERTFSNKEKLVASNETSVSGESPPGQLMALASDMRRLGNSNNLPVPVRDENRLPVPAPRKKRDPKKYHLVDAKGRVLGPLSPGEIQSLYYRGVVDRGVKVVRDGSTSKVAVAKFVMAYAEAQGIKKMPKQGAHPNIQGASKSALNRLALMRRAQQMQRATGMSVTTMAILGAALILIVLTMGMLWRHGAFHFFQESRSAIEESQPKKTKRIEKKPVKKSIERRMRVPTARPQSSGPIGGALERPGRKVKPAVKVDRPLRKAQPKRAERPRVRPFYTKPQPPPRRPVVSSPNVIRPVAQPRPVARPAAMVKPVTPPAATKAPPKAKGLTVSSLTDGQSVSGLGPMTYNKDSIDICDGACNVMFFGAGGAVNVAFFKNTWGQALMNKTGGIYISGLVRKNGGSVKIILSGVK